jgi:large conductance mechanosensitive channel
MAVTRKKMLDATRGFFQEFKSFAVKGNVFDLAIAVVIGNAFSGIVNSFVSDIVTPFLGLLTGKVDVKNLQATFSPQLVVRYGSFLQAIINFLIISLSIFIVFKVFSAARKRLFREGEDAVPEHEKPAQERLLEEIRDLLEEKK